MKNFPLTPRPLDPSTPRPLDPSTPRPLDPRIALQTAKHGLLVVRIVGVITVAALFKIKAQIARNQGAATISAFVVDFGQAIIAMDGAGLDQVLEGETHGAVAALPAAMIVAPAVYNLFSGHCMRMATRGIVRSAFTDSEPALRWAARHAQRNRS